MLIVHLIHGSCRDNGMSCVPYTMLSVARYAFRSLSKVDRT
jgi:hypothetical protein